MKVVHFGKSLIRRAPTYEHAERTPPSIACTVISRGPRYGTRTSLPSGAVSYTHLRAHET